MLKLLVLGIALGLSINNYAQNDSNDCYMNFFKRTEKHGDPRKIMLLYGGKHNRTLQFLYDNNRSEIGNYAKAGFIDLDKDGYKELIVYFYSGGAHCCDVYDIFSQVKPGQYKLMAATWGGEACFNENNLLEYSFYEHYGYFYTCFACELEDSSDSAPIPVRTVQLTYNKGKLSVLPGDAVLKATIKDNLRKLSEHPYQELAEGEFDDGLRKEFALNLIVYYYSFGKNLPETEKLFNTYYKFPDAKKIWYSFLGYLNDIKKENSF